MAEPYGVESLPAGQSKAEGAYLVIIWALQRRDEAGAKDEQMGSSEASCPDREGRGVVTEGGRWVLVWEKIRMWPSGGGRSEKITGIEFVLVVGSRCEGYQSHPRCRDFGGAHRILRLARGLRAVGSESALGQNPMASCGGGGGLDGVAAWT